MIIYKTTNLINGKTYIGKSTKDDPKYFGSGLLLRKAIHKYGIENFKKEIICVCSSIEEMNEKEKFWINEYSGENSYNIATGGEGGDTLTNNPNLDKIKQKISDACVGKQLGNKRSDETKRKMSEAGKRRIRENNPMYGKHHSIETKNIISLKITKFFENIENHPMYGRFHTDEARKKISIANKGRKFSDETKRKMSLSKMGEKNSFYNKKHSSSSREKMRLAWKKRRPATCQENTL